MPPENSPHPATAHADATQAVTAKPPARPRVSKAFKDFIAEFVLFAKVYVRYHDIYVGMEGLDRRTVLRKGAVAMEAGADAAPAHVFELFETVTIKYPPVPIPASLNQAGRAATSLINDMRNNAAQSEKRCWWITFAPAAAAPGWRLLHADFAREGGPRERLAGRAETAWINKVLAMHEDSGAQYALAGQYDRGLHVKQDHALAVHWYRKAAMHRTESAFMADFPEMAAMYRNGSAAMCNLGDKYENGQGVEQDYRQAVFWYAQSAALDNHMAEYSLGQLYMKGAGVEKNLATAAHWFRRSAEHGWAPSGYWLEQIETGKVA